MKGREGKGRRSHSIELPSSAPPAKAKAASRSGTSAGAREKARRSEDLMKPGTVESSILPTAVVARPAERAHGPDNAQAVRSAQRTGERELATTLPWAVGQFPTENVVGSLALSHRGMYTRSTEEGYVAQVSHDPHGSLTLHRSMFLAAEFDEETRSQDSGQGLRTVETHVNIQNSLGKQQSQHAGDGTGDASEMLRLPNVKDPKSAEIIEEPSDLRAFDKSWARRARQGIIESSPSHRGLVAHVDSEQEHDVSLQSQLLFDAEKQSESDRASSRGSLQSTADASEASSRPISVFKNDGRSSILQVTSEGGKPNDDSGSDDSEHFDLTHLETPVASPIITPTSHLIKDIATSSQDQVEPQISPISLLPPIADTVEMEAPAPPPRARSRSSTPPSDHEAYFEMRRKKHKAKKKRANGGLPDQTSRFPPPVAPETDIPSEQKGETNTHGHREIEERCIPVTYTYETSPEGAQVPSEKAELIGDAELISTSQEGDQDMAREQHIEEDRRPRAKEDSEEKAQLTTLLLPRAQNEEVRPRTKIASNSSVEAISSRQDEDQGIAGKQRIEEDRRTRPMEDTKESAQDSSSESAAARSQRVGDQRSEVGVTHSSTNQFDPPSILEVSDFGTPITSPGKYSDLVVSPDICSPYPGKSASETRPKGVSLQRPVKAQLMDVLDASFEQQRKDKSGQISEDELQRAASLEDELRFREELAHKACSSKDVAALCFALSFTKSSTKSIGEQSSQSPSESLERSGTKHWQEAQLSPLHEAAAVGSEEMMALLLERGNFTIDSRTTGGNTALHICIWEGHLRAAEFLMGRGASTAIENRNGQRAFDLLSPGILEPFSADDLPLLMKAAAAAAVLKAENILGVRSHESERVKRHRFRDLANLANPSDVEVENIDSQSSGRGKFFNVICAAYDVLLHHKDIKYTASRASFRTTDEWAEVFFVLESKGLADIIEWFLRNELDGQQFLELSIDEMCALGLDADRALGIWRALHGDQSVETLEEWLMEHGEQALCADLLANGITSVQHLMDANLKEVVRKVGPRRRLEQLVQQQRAAPGKPALIGFHDVRAQSAHVHARYIPADTACKLHETSNSPEHDTKKSDDTKPVHIIEDIMMKRQFDGKLRDAMIDIADELAESTRREHQTHLEMRVRIQKLKLRIKELNTRAERAEDRASCAVEQHEAALIQLQQEARKHAQMIAGKDAQIISVQAQLNEAKIETLANDSLSSWPWSQVVHASTLHTESQQDFSGLLADSENSFALSASHQDSTISTEDLALEMARSCVRRNHARRTPRVQNLQSLTNHKNNDSLGMSSIADRENGPTNQVKHTQEDIDEKQALTRKQALRTLRLINKELQMQAVDLKTMLAEAKRDKTVDNATISSLQQRINFLSTQLEQQKEARRKEESESRALTEQLESLLTAVTGLVGNEELVDVMCQEVYQVKLINSKLLKALRSKKDAPGFNASYQREARHRKLNEDPPAAFFCKQDYSRLRGCCFEARIGNAEDAHIWAEVEELLHENEAMMKHLEAKGQAAVYKAEREREQNKNALEQAMLKMVRQLEEEVKGSKDEFAMARQRMLDTSKKLLRREREQGLSALKSLSIAHVHLDRQAERARARQKTEQEENKDLSALAEATKAIEKLEGEVKSLRAAQRVQRGSISENDEKSCDGERQRADDERNVLGTSVSDLEAQSTLMKEKGSCGFLRSVDRAMELPPSSFRRQPEAHDAPPPPLEAGPSGVSPTGWILEAPERS